MKRLLILFLAIWITNTIGCEPRPRPVVYKVSTTRPAVAPTTRPALDPKLEAWRTFLKSLSYQIHHPLLPIYKLPPPKEV